MDNLINDKIDMFIMASMKNHDDVRKETLRAIKAAFLNWKTDKENVGKTLDENAELQILKKMVKQREDSIEQYTTAGRTDLAEAELAQVQIIKEFLPKPVSKEAILNAFRKVVDGGVEPVKKNMGIFIKSIKGYLPAADGKLVAQVVQENLH